MNIKKESLIKISFILFLIFYLSIGTSLSIPKGNILRWIGCIVLIIISLLSKIKNRDNFRIYPFYFNYILIAIVLSFIFNTYVLYVGFFRALSFFIAVCAIFLYYDRKEVTIQYIKNDYKIFFIIIALITLIQFIVLIFNFNEFGNFKGIYGNRNFYTSINLISLVMSINIFLRKRFLGTTLIAINIILLFATGSRTAIIGMIFVLIISPILFCDNFNINKILKLSFIYLLIIIAAFIILKYVDIPAIDRIFQKSSENGSTGLSRGEYWISAFNIFKEKPVLGWGNSSVYYHIINHTSDRIWGFHNSYLVILVENGLIGSIFYFIFFLFSFLINIRRYFICNLDKYDKVFVKTLFLICITLLINAISEAFLFAVGNPVSICFWLCFIMIVKVLEIKLKGFKIGEKK
ncbi:O-antigen ligase family protein [Clostridium perfringens]|uniref:O-antigen ligase family protein n=1 Tax=Clostridium perfringens TaxID=1502 RepID=UPI001ABACBC7|nr:O-antigen ligase family protein [Clostridium perfringens]MBO3388516.1 O-antigen ligase family protein [Clostridium perfringens]MBO3413938.1 O-antigen ligase family protein [Clostridium perfringens]